MANDSHMQAKYVNVLTKMVHRIQDADILWVLTGSLAFALQKIPVDVHDIDIQTDERGAHEIARLFQEHLTESVRLSSTGLIRSHFGRLMVDCINVEIMGDLQKRMSESEWESAPDIKALRRYIDIDDHKIPVFPLEYEYKAYQMLGRSQTAILLRNWLDHHPQKT